jgi:hypothetical protein
VRTRDAVHRPQAPSVADVVREQVPATHPTGW